ncbi:MAG: hypothetical protein B1H08_02230 [Candidatus Omnitrophica bacterium 4484_171]|nr:MAG: hypothetical protein B1H08_02230 [Candidatus Omnitrophica bacterium 4484_171]
MRILVADDNKELMDILKIFLEKKGHTVTTAADGNEALENLKSNAYDLAFVDHNMPELTGVELVKFVKKNNIKTKMVILTGYPSMKDFFAKSVGADGYINKPCSLEDVESIVNEYTQ